MLDRLAARSLFWCALALVSVLCGALTLGADATATMLPIGTIADAGLLPSVMATRSLALASPYLSAVALGMALAGWRLVRHREPAVPFSGEEMRQQAHRERVYAAMQASTDGMLVLRAVLDEDGTPIDFEATDVNPMAERLLRTPRTALVGARLRERGWLDDAHFEQYAAAVASGAAHVAEERVDPRRFATSWLMHHAIPVHGGLVVTLRDIAARKRDEGRLHRASITDELTGLHNRRGFLAFAEQSLRLARRQETDVVLLYVDMDEFKALNDRHGHAAGDRALAAVGRLLRRSVRDCDLVARMGGDEFTLLAMDADGAGARLIQRRIEEGLAALNAAGELETPLALTIGHTRVRPTDTASLGELLARADTLLLSRKRQRKLLAAARQQAAARGEMSTPSRAPSIPRPSPATTVTERWMPDAAVADATHGTRPLQMAMFA